MAGGEQVAGRGYLQVLVVGHKLHHAVPDVIAHKVARLLDELENGLHIPDQMPPPYPCVGTPA